MIDWLKEFWSDHCASHLPVLALAARVAPIRKVVEFGSGRFSTRAFLDRRLFPDLESLTSYEDDEKWAQRARELVSPDTRWALRPVSDTGASARLIYAGGVSGADLVLVDNGRDRASKRGVLVEALFRTDFAGLVLLHDADDKMNRNALSVFPNCRLFAPARGHPTTAAMSIAEGPVVALRQAAPDTHVPTWLDLINPTKAPPT